MKLRVNRGVMLVSMVTKNEINYDYSFKYCVHFESVCPHTYTTRTGREVVAVAHVYHTGTEQCRAATKTYLLNVD